MKILEYFSRFDRWLPVSTHQHFTSFSLLFFIWDFINTRFALSFEDETLRCLIFYSFWQLKYFNSKTYVTLSDVWTPLSITTMNFFIHYGSVWSCYSLSLLLLVQLAFYDEDLVQGSACGSIVLLMTINSALVSRI